RLIPGMAHILNSPAAGIAAMLGQFDNELKKQSPNLGRLKQYVDLIKRNTLSIAVMSRTLSAEIVARVGPQNAEQTELIALLRQHLDKIRPLVPTGIQMRLESQVDQYYFPLSQSERTWVEVVMFNLLHNALKFSPPDNGIIIVDCVAEADCIHVRVTDNGPGIAEDALPHIYQPLFRRETKGWPQGTGMGLYEVRRLLDQLGWDIQASNTQPHGARFCIRIPQNWRHKHEQQKDSSIGR
ncbi:MAG: sensor histidine kinase, partial [Verrucomicrobia bacterium]|nr:sensor histidine kinase [Verrucomicrobiota bacterium]